MNDQIKQNLLRASTWKRGLMMLLLTIFYSIAELVLFMIVFFQFLFKLVTNEPNPRLKQLGLEIASYLYQVACYLSFNSDDPVYPFAEWPQPREAVRSPTSTAPSAPDTDERQQKIEQDQDSTAG